MMSSNTDERKKWIYQVRALGILAVVVFHQIGLLHNSWLIQYICIFNMTSLIFLLGITSSLWFEKKGRFEGKEIFPAMLHKMLPVMCSYIVATLAMEVFASKTMKGQWNYTVLLNDLLSFGGAPPYYFLEYYFAFTLMSPFVFAVLSAVKDLRLRDRYGRILKAAAFTGIVLFSFFIGYINLDWIHFFGGSFFSVYVLGMIWGLYGCGFGKKVITLPIGIVSLVFGWINTYTIYSNINNGTNELPYIDRFTPRLSLNPPYISIIIYAVSIVFVFGILFDLGNRIEFKPVVWMNRLIEVIGKYSLDIYLWHVFIMVKINRPDLPWWPRRILYYSCMIFLPILGRVGYTGIRNWVRKELDQR